jgi:hypothetical protein
MHKPLCAGMLGSSLALLIGLAFGAAPQAGAEPKKDDAVQRGLLAGKDVPRDVLAVRQRLVKLGGNLATHMVANRGHDNPKLGSFSFFETYTGPIPGGKVGQGEFFLGFFTVPNSPDGKLTVDNEPAAGALMMELIAWDYTKELYNFWELIGDGKTGQWKYRGDSNDILADVAEVYLTKDRPKFGKRLRCSACHTLGGPIMKEIDEPYNDWHSGNDPLPLGTWKLDEGEGKEATNPRHVAALLYKNAGHPSRMAGEVVKGIDKLIQARVWHKDKLNMRHQLRSLFATMEINLASDTVPFSKRVKDGRAVQLPQEFFVDAFFAGQQQIPVDLKVYQAVLQKVNARFAAKETPGLVESYHAFNVPVRSWIDHVVRVELRAQGLLDRQMIASVLAIDFTTPIHSKKRAALLRFVPEKAKDGADLRKQLMAELEKAKGDPDAQQLLTYLSDPKKYTVAHFAAQARDYLDVLRKGANDVATVFDWWRIASQRRVELKTAPTAPTPTHNITEPGFRVIFPEDNLKSTPGQLWLDPKTGRCTGT